MILGISILGWLHSAFCVVALCAGPFALVMTKGTRLHKTAGYIYAVSMLIGCATALGLYAPIPGLPTFNRFHWMSIATLVMVAFAIWAAPRQRSRLGAYVHPMAMIGSYYMLLGATINEAFARIEPLRVYAIATTPGAHNVLQSRLLAMAQGLGMLIMVSVAVYFAVRIARGRRRAPVLMAAE
jgi:uncharacterized membrane protein